jgi:hypothetical protein
MSRGGAGRGKRRDRWAGQRLGLRGVIVIIVAGAAGVFWLVAGIGRFRDHAILAERGVVVDATIVEGGSRGSATVRFTTDARQEVQAVVRDAPSDATLVAGASLPIRYDPADPIGRLEPVGQDQAAISRWFYLLSGAGVLGLGVYASLWWALKDVRRRPRYGGS